MFLDSFMQQKIAMSHTKVSYKISHGLGLYFLEKSIGDIMNIPNIFYTVHFDETTTSQLKKQLNVLVRYYSHSHHEVRVSFLKALVFGHAYAETVADELWKCYRN